MGLSCSNFPLNQSIENPLVLNIVIYSWFAHEKLWFSIATGMLIYQRVSIRNGQWCSPSRQAYAASRVADSPFLAEAGISQTSVAKVRSNSDSYGLIIAKTGDHTMIWHDMTWYDARMSHSSSKADGLFPAVRLGCYAMWPLRSPNWYWIVEWLTIIYSGLLTINHH